MISLDVSKLEINNSSLRILKYSLNILIYISIYKAIFKGWPPTDVCTHYI
jgi:hypothetical protein